MRCLNCHKDAIAKSETSCPECGAYFPLLLREMLPAGTLLCNDTYRIHSPLDQGGFGIIYRAVHIALDSVVAIKEFYPKAYAQRGSDGRVQIPPKYRETFEMERKQFLREGQILADLNLHGIINVLNLFEAHNTAYLVMEMLQGQPLRQELNQRKKLSSDQVRKIIRQLVITLEALHRRGVYHLDIKPENVFFTRSERIVLVDFGAARLGKNDTIMPQFDPAYAPPELLRKRGDVGPQSDLFELGTMAYELLTGVRPASVQERNNGKDWNVANLQDPLWLSSLPLTLHPEKEKRPSSVLGWWLQTIGAGLPRVFIDDPKIFLDAEEAQAKLEERLAHFHNEYNVLHNRLSKHKNLLREREQELKELKEVMPPIGEQERQWREKLQKEQKGKDELKQAIRTLNIQITEHKDLLKKKEQELNELRQNKLYLGEQERQWQEKLQVKLQEERKGKDELKQAIRTLNTQITEHKDLLKKKEQELNELKQSKLYLEQQQRASYTNFLREQEQKNRLGQALNAANAQVAAYNEAGQRLYEEMQAKNWQLQTLNRQLANPQRKADLQNESLGTVLSILLAKIGEALGLQGNRGSS